MNIRYFGIRHIISQFTQTAISGHGFIAMAAVIFGKWTPELEQQFRDSQTNALALARHGFADKVIAPEESRKYLIGALQTFINSR